MERVGRVLGKLEMSRQGVTDEQLALAAWPVAIGKKLAQRTRAVSLVRTRLVIEVEDTVWQRQLFALRGQIIDRLQGVSGRPIVAELEFRVAIPRREPGRAAAPERAADEADDIRNPMLRRIYVASRKKATA